MSSKDADGSSVKRQQVNRKPQRPHTNRQTRHPGSKEDRERLKRLREEGRCFNCESPDHLAKDCPTRHNMKPPMTLNSMELMSPNEVRLAALSEGAQLGLFHADIEPMNGQYSNEGPSDARRARRDALWKLALAKLYNAIPLPFDELVNPESDPYALDRFSFAEYGGIDTYLLSDGHNGDGHVLYYSDLADPYFDLLHWLHAEKSKIFDELIRGKRALSGPDLGDSSGDSDDGRIAEDSDCEDCGESSEGEYSGKFENYSQGNTFCVSSIGVTKSSDANINALERNSARVKRVDRICPKPVVIVVHVNGQPCRALLDSGSLSDFMSTTLADQLKLKLETLDKPLALQLAVSGSRSRVKVQTTVGLRYQRIDEQRVFDIVNLDSYDLILGTPFLFQHQILLGFNPSQVNVRSAESLPIRGTQTLILESRATEIRVAEIATMREELRQYALPICKEAIETPLPPLRVINHTIPLIDPEKVYSWRPSRCPEQMKPLWRAKRDDYLRTGRWEFRSGPNVVPMLMLKKPSKDGILRLRTVCDTRERNKNSRRLASPLPDIEAILRNVVSHPYRTLLDGKDAYEQIRVEPSHVDRTLFTTPDGTMASLVMQIGDCNASATYQTLMNHIFADYIGVFMDVYLDDIVVYSDSPEEHVRHVKLVIDRLRDNKFFLSDHKLQFFKDELNILGHVIDSEGIRMDPDKVDRIFNWKTPTNKSLLSSFIGAVGYLAPGCMGIRIPMQVLSNVAAPTHVWRWTPTEARAFQQVKDSVQRWRDVCRKSIDYSQNGPRINLCCDACLTGGSGVISQGDDYLKADIVAFWSGKFNSAQQNYPVHELELLAIVESLRRFGHLLQGIKFRVYTDHKGLEWITSQKKLSPRQARWLEVLSDFDFEIVHVPGEANQLADALSRIYSDEPKGIVRAESEYVSAEPENAPPSLILNMVSAPVYTGESIFLGATSSKWRARQAFPNATRVVLRVSDPSQPLEGERPTENSQNSEDLNSLDGAAELFVEQATEAAVNIPMSIRTESDEVPMDIDMPHSPRDIIGLDDDGAGTELLSEDPVSLTEVIASGDPTLDIHGRIIGRFAEDPFFKRILENPANYRNFEVSNQIVYLRDNDKRILCIPDIKIGERRLREILISHAHSILAHLGPRKTVTYLRGNVWWKGLSADVEAFCESCTVCKTSKPVNHPPYGLLHTLEVPTRPWETIGVDFVGPLPESSNLNGVFDMIMVVICHLTSLVHLIPTKQTYRAKDVAEVMFDRVYKHHGMPKHIVSDRDSLFTSTFWRRLNELTGTELRMSSSFHPQSDGATERANRTITQMLRQCVAPDQRDWVLKLPAIEFAINSASSQTTGYAPFVLNYGRMPRSMIWNSNTEYPGVRTFAQRMKDAVLTAHDAIIASRMKQTRAANNQRKEAPFALGDLVYLSTKNLSLPKGRARKLAPKFVGPYKILQDYKNNTFLLDLPSELKQRGLHPSFHASLLRLHVPSDDRRFPGRQLKQLSTLGNNEEWAVAEIATHHGKGADALFEVVWKAGDRAWLPYQEISHLEAMTQYLEVQGAKTISQLPKHISNRPSLPIASVRPRHHRSMRKFAMDTVSWIENYPRRVDLPTPVSGRSREFKREFVRTRGGHEEDTMYLTYTPEEQALFTEFGERIRKGEITDSDEIPKGYLEYAVLTQFGTGPVPLPPKAPVVVLKVNGKNTFTLSPEEPTDVRLLREDKEKARGPRPKKKSPSSRRFLDERKELQALINQRFTKDSMTRTSRRKSYRKTRKPNAVKFVPAVAGPSRNGSLYEENARLRQNLDELSASTTERPRKTPRYNNRSLDNREAKKSHKRVEDGNAMGMLISIMIGCVLTAFISFLLAED